MEAEDARRFAACIAALAVATRGELDDPTIELYFRALEDVPIDLLEAASIELARTSQWFPRPAEWRRAVDIILDRTQQVHGALGPARGPDGQLLLPGDVGAPWQCPECDGTGWRRVETPCEKTGCFGPGRDKGPHTHPAVTRCTNAQCEQERTTAAARRRRYFKEG